MQCTSNNTSLSLLISMFCNLHRIWIEFDNRREVFIDLEILAPTVFSLWQADLVYPFETENDIFNRSYPTAGQEML